MLLSEMVTKSKRIEYKLKKIGEILGEKAVVRIGLNPEAKNLDIISIDVLFDENKVKDEPLEPKIDYVG